MMTFKRGVLAGIVAGGLLATTALAYTPEEQRAFDMMTARGFSNITVESAGSVIHAEGDRNGHSYEFIYNTASGKLMGRDDAEHDPNLDVNEEKIVRELERRGYTNIVIRQTGAVVRAEADKGGKTYEVKYNTANGRFMAEREVTSSDDDQRRDVAGKSADHRNDGRKGDDRGDDDRGTDRDDDKGDDDKGRGN